MKNYDGWKVITSPERMSVTMQANSLAVQYPVNEKVFPKNSKAKLFFFATRKNARDFIKLILASHCRHLTKYKIVKCKADNSNEIEFLICSMWTDIALWWACGKRYYGPSSAPEGTMVADSITCLE